MISINYWNKNEKERNKIIVFKCIIKNILTYCAGFIHYLNLNPKDEIHGSNYLYYRLRESILLGKKIQNATIPRWFVSYPQVSAKKLSPINKSAVLIRFLVFLLRNVKDHFMPLVRRLSHAQNHLELLFRPKKVVERKGAVRSLAFCVTRMRTILDFADLATIKIMDI